MSFRKHTYTEGSDVFKISSPDTSDAVSAREEQQHRVIVDNWESFAAAAHTSFRRFGIGAIVVEEDALKADPAAHPFARHKIWYATGFDDWTQQGQLETEKAWLEAQLQTYDPSTACMFVFLNPQEGTHVYLVESTLKPEAALARVKAMLN